MYKHVVLLKARLGQTGGLEKYALRIAKGFLHRGLNVSLLSSSESCSLPNISLHSLPTCRWPAFRRMEQYDLLVQKWLKKHKADLIFGMDRNRVQTHIRAGNGVHAAFLERRLVAEGRLKWLACQINPLHRKMLSIERSAFEYPGLQKLFTNSNMVREDILRFYRTDPSKIEVIHNGVEWQEMERNFSQWIEERPLHLKRFHLDPSRFHFLFLGNGYLRKGLKQLLFALSRIEQSTFHLSVIGKDNNIEEYRALASRLNLTSHVTFFGPQEDTCPFYQLADALVIPSFYDPFANVTVEALAMGLFVVSSRSNGGHEILDDQKGCIIRELTDIDSVADALKQALKHPKTQNSANLIRNSVNYLDFSNQLPKLIDACLT